MNQVEILFDFLAKTGIVFGDDIPQQRTEQILHYLNLKSLQGTTAIIIDVIQKLGLSGNFGGFDKPLVSNLVWWLCFDMYICDLIDHTQC